MSNASFALKKPPANSALFMPTGAATQQTGSLLNIAGKVVNLEADELRHYCSHPFKLYRDERRRDMVESIKANGIIVPLIVRRLSPDVHEILAGHNRFECGKEAELTEFPCIIKEGLTDEEAHLIVTESNLVQRSFSDLTHSERAEALSTHYNAIKQQGKRTDLIKEVETLLKGENATNGENAGDNGNSPTKDTNTPPGNKSIEVTGEKYGLSRNSVARYIRVNDLIAGFKELLDSEELSIRAGVSLSYINEVRQQEILEQIKRYEVVISMKKAEQLKVLDGETSGSDEDFTVGCADILIGKVEAEKETKPAKAIRFKLDRSAVEAYFNEDDTEEAMREKVLEALEFYHRFYGRHKEQLTDAKNSQEAEA